MTDRNPQPHNPETSNPDAKSAAPPAGAPFARSKLLSGAAAAAVIGLGLATFAWTSHPSAAPAQSAAMAPVRLASAVPMERPARVMQNGAPFSFADLVERVSPSVVTVTVEEKPQPAVAEQDVPAPFRNFFRDFGGQQQQPAQKALAMGSGFIIDPAGYIVTNHHVVADGRKITVKLQDGRNFTAKLIGSDDATDISLLKIDTGKPLPAVQFADDRSVRVGDWVVAMGNPFGLSNTVTAGIVSSLGRDIGAGSYTDYIQIDAPINRGNSGGPAFDVQGKVIGMNSMIYSPSGGSVGIGFAIPASTIHGIVAQLKSHGKVARGWLGVEIQSFTPEMAASIGNSQAQGAIVAKIVPDGPAARAGFHQGDVIVAINGTPVHDNRDLTRRVGAIPAGSAAQFGVLRGGQKLTLTARIGLRAPNPQLASLDGPAAGASSLQAMGLGLSGLTPDLRRQFNLDPGANGVVVTKVDPDSDAADKGLQPGDVIVAIGNQAVHSPQDIQQSIAQAKKLGRSAVLALVMTDGVQRYVALGIAKG